MMTAPKRAYRVFAIEQGTVIDHIDAGYALKVVDMLGLDNKENIITVGMNFDSGKIGKKDIIKIENLFLTREQLDRIAIISPHATINIIKDHEVSEKFKVEIPDKFKDVIKCRNPNCISRNEPVESEFATYSKDPLLVKCRYCEKVFMHFQLL